MNSRMCEGAVDTHPADPKCLVDGSRAVPSGSHFTHSLDWNSQHGHKDRPRRILGRAHGTPFARSVLPSSLVLVAVAMMNVGIVRMLVPSAPAVGSLRRHGESARSEGAVQKPNTFWTDACGTGSELTRRAKTLCGKSDFPHEVFG